MPASVTINTRQHVSAGISILDTDGQPFANIPPGVTAEFISSDPTVAAFVVGSDGLNGDVTSGLVGTCTITATVTGVTSSPISDTLAVAVVNAAPGSVNFTVGSPVDET